MAWDELELHRWLRRTLGDRGLAGARGNDAAALAAGLAAPVVCVDQTVAGVHHERGTPGKVVGHKACARALSDLAASAAEPRAVLASLAVHRTAEAAWIRAALRSVAATAERFGACLAGGDLSTLPGPRGSAVLSVTAVGERTVPGRPVGRERARPGELVLLTGPVGGSIAGRHLDFEPRVAAGRWLGAVGARCLMDTTDGLALDLDRIARASGVRIDLERVPLHRDARRLARAGGRTALERALSDGEDYELLATLSPAAWRRARARPEVERVDDRGEDGFRVPELGVPGLFVVGTVRRGRGLLVPEREPVDGERPTLVRWKGGGHVHGR